MNNFTLIINLSLSSVKVLIFDDRGRKVHENWLPVRTYINGASVEQDPNEWWQSLLELLRKIFSIKDFSSYIQFMTVTSSSSCLVMLDKNGNVLEKSFMVSDKRALSESKFLESAYGHLFHKTTLHPEPSLMIPKVLWLKRNKKAVFSKVAKFMSANDFIIYKLTGEFLTDELNAEKFFYDIKNNSYPNEILRYLDLSPKHFPKVVSPGTIGGEVIEKLKKELNISHRINVAISTYDALCALVGGSSFTEGELNNVCGTCSSYRMFCKKINSEKNNSLLVQFMPSEHLSIIGASNNLEGGVLEWAKECFYGDNYLKNDTFLYELMQSEAEESTLGANGIIFLPYLLGERKPFLDCDVRGTFFGIERFHTRKDIIRSVFEATCFQAKLMLEEFEKNGYTISQVRMSGGVAKMPFAAQLRADVLGLPINVLEEVETTALGAFILTLKARKKIKSISQAKKLAKINRTYLPNMHNHNSYASLFILYKELYKQNKEIFKKRREVFDKIIHYHKKVLENL